MDYIHNIFQRADLQQMRSFLLNGVQELDSEIFTYKERLQKGDASIYTRLEKLYPDENDLDKAAADLADALTAHEDVYFEIGMKAGTRIIFQLLYMYCT